MHGHPPCGTRFDVALGMLPDCDYALARIIADQLKGKFWEVTLGEWWVVVEGVTSQKLVVLTNDPFGVAFTPDKPNRGVLDLKKRVMGYLLQSGIIYEDGSWAQPLSG